MSLMITLNPSIYGSFPLYPPLLLRVGFEPSDEKTMGFENQLPGFENPVKGSGIYHLGMTVHWLHLKMIVEHLNLNKQVLLSL